MPMTGAAAPTILLAEDDEVLRSTTARVLVKLGYQVVDTTDGVEALQAFEANADAIGLVLSDVVMPRLDGLGLLQALRAMGRGVSVLLVSGRSEADLPAELVDAAVRFLPKPWTVSDLARAVREAMALAPLAAEAA